MLEEKADILFLAAIENQITVYNAFNIQANYVVSAVNGGITQEGYHILRENRKIIGSDSIVKSGGIIASYLEKFKMPKMINGKRSMFLKILLRG